MTSLELTLLGPHGINGWKVQQKAHRYSITNLLQTILDRRPIAVSFLQQSADDGDGLMVQIKHHHREEQGGNHLHLHDHQHGEHGHNLHHHDHCHGEGQGGPRRAGRATAVGQSISRQSVAVERPSATKDGQEMARDGKRWCGKARKHDDNPRHSSRYLAHPTHSAASQLLQTSKLLQTVGVLQSVE